VKPEDIVAAIAIGFFLLPAGLWFFFQPIRAARYFLRERANQIPANDQNALLFLRGLGIFVAGFSLFIVLALLFHSQ
jgi:hypothetical protein